MARFRNSQPAAGKCWLFTLNRTAIRFTLFLLSSVAIAQAQQGSQQAPPLYFVASGDFQGQSYSFDSRPSISFSSPNVSLTGSLNAASAHLSYTGVLDENNAINGCFVNGGSFIAGAEGVLEVYVRGAPGTSFHIEYNETGTSHAFIAADEAYCGEAERIGVFTGIPGLSLSPVLGGPSLTGTAAVPPQIIDGSSSGQTVTFMGTTYSRAGGFLLAPCCLYLSLNFFGSNFFSGHADYHIDTTVNGYVVSPNQQPPVAVISPPVPTSPTAGTPVTLDGIGSYSPTGTPLVEYKWTIQDPAAPNGTATQSGPTTQYTWQQDGTYNVTLTVTDSDGLTGTASISIPVGSGGACKGIPKIIGANANAAHVYHHDNNFPDGSHDYFSDGNFYHYGLASTDSMDPSNCTFDGTIWEVVTTLTDTCGFAPHRASVAGGAVRQGPDDDGNDPGFTNWIGDLLAAPRLSPPLDRSCKVTAVQQLLWFSADRSRSADLTQPQNTHLFEITVNPAVGSTVTTTSFSVRASTTYGQ